MSIKLGITRERASVKGAALNQRLTQVGYIELEYFTYSPLVGESSPQNQLVNSTRSNSNRMANIATILSF